jgi:hypothetical protein
MDLAGYARKDEEQEEQLDPRLVDADFVVFKKLATSSIRWFLILKFQSKDAEPMQTNYSNEAFMNMYSERKLSGATLCCGLSCRYLARGIVLPASFFR